MTEKEKIRIWTKAIKTYGVPAQMDMLVEECAELIVEVNHYKRNLVKGGETNLSKLLSEIADVEIMIKQMKLIFNENTINGIVEFKTRRLRERIEQGLP